MKNWIWLGTAAGFWALNAFSADSLIPPSPFEKTKVILSQAPTSIAAQGAARADLIALMDLDCVSKNGLGSLKSFKSEIDLKDSTPNLTSHRKILKLTLKKSVSPDRINQFANSSSCIIGISNDAEYHVNATLDDPMISDQEQHAFLHTSDFYAKSSWLPTDDSSRAIIAVIDTGVNYNHPDLSSVIYRKNGSMVGASFVDGTPDFMDDHGHGSHVSGLAAAQAGNGIGGSGICGMSCFVMPVKVLDAKGSGVSSAINNGVFWAVDHGADIINMSLGRVLNFTGMAPMDLEAFRYALLHNVTVAVAAGNDGATLDLNGPQSWPAMFAPLPGLVTVASLDASSGALSTFSNRSPHFVEIAAPGSFSSTNGVYVGLLSTSKDGGYVRMSGTSMATPIVAGSMGLIVSYLKSLRISYTPWDVEAVLKSATVTDSALSASVEGGRRLDLSILANRLQDHLDHPFRLNVQDRLERFVNDLYYLALRRDYDVGGAQYALGIMKQYRVPLETMLLDYFGSQEFRNTFGDIYDHDNIRAYQVLNDHYIPDVYLALLGRMPASQESQYWSNYLSVYRNKQRYLIRALVSSAEFDSKIAGTTLVGYPRMEKLPGDVNARCLAKDFPQGDFSYETQVDFGYCIAFERSPDTGGKAYFLGLLKNGTKLEDLYLGLFRSSEFNDSVDMPHVSDAEYVQILYYAILQRLPKDYEGYYWQTVIQSQGRDAVLSAFINSDEFKQLLKTKGIRQ